MTCQPQSCHHPYLRRLSSQWVPWVYAATYLLEASGAIGVGGMVWCHICLSLSSIFLSHSTNFLYLGTGPILKS